MWIVDINVKLFTSRSSANAWTSNAVFLAMQKSFVEISLFVNAWYVPDKLTSNLVTKIKEEQSKTMSR